MSLFNKNSNKEQNLVDQNDLSMDSEKQIMPEDHISDELGLREDFNNEDPFQIDEKSKTVVSNSESDENSNFGFEEFINTFAEGKQEEVVLSENAIKMIKEDIVLEKNKHEFKISYIIIAVVFSILIFCSVFVAYILSSYDIVWGYNVAEAKYYFDSPIKFSVVPKEINADTNYLKPGMEVLYYEGETGAFTKYKKFYIETVNKTNVFGYDYESKERKTLMLENIHYILDEKADEPPADSKPNNKGSTESVESKAA